MALPAFSEMIATERNPAASPDSPEADSALERMMDNATEAANFLKAVAHTGRMMILCHLATGEKSVTELEMLLSARQSAVSQQLARLRLEGLITPRREGKAIYYSLADGRATRVMDVLYDMFCTEEPDGR